MKHPTGDPNVPEAIRLAKEVHHAIHRRAHLGSAAEKFDLLSGEFNYGRRSSNHQSSTHFVYDEEIDDEPKENDNDYLNPAMIEDYTITGQRAVQDDNSSKYKQGNNYYASWSY